LLHGARLFCENRLRDDLHKSLEKEYASIKVLMLVPRIEKEKIISTDSYRDAGIVDAAKRIFLSNRDFTF